MRPLRLLCALTSLALAACEQPLAAVERDLLSHLPKGEAQRQVLCARGRSDAVTAAFCTPEAPALSSLAELQDLMGVSFTAAVPPAFSLIAHSSALPARSVSSMNPGSVIVSLPVDPRPLNGTPGPRRADGNVLSLAFARGDEAVELIVMPPGGEMAFYLLKTERACGDDCPWAELLTEATESGWTGWSLYDDVDLENSVFDCLHCHQPDGPGTPRITRMQELENPWTHWAAPFTLSGRVLLDDIVHANPDEATVAGIPRDLIVRTDPVAVEDLIRFTDSAQPNVFPSPDIEREVMESSPAQPRDNSTPGTSPSWDVVYARAVRGEAIPPPWHDVKVTDATKLLAMTEALASFRAGQRAALPDLRDVFTDDALSGMSHRPQSGLDGRGILVHACAQCHNGRLNQDLSKSRFNALDLDSMDQAERDLAVERMLLPSTDRNLMPPRLFRALSAEEIERATDALRATAE